MIDFLKRWWTVIATVPLLIAGWSTVVTVVINIETAMEVIEMAKEEDENGLTGLQRYRQLEAQHHLLWEDLKLRNNQ